MQDSINVLHVLNSAHGGSALSTFQLMEELKKSNINSSLVCFNNASAEQEKKIRALVDNRVIFIPLYWSNKRTRVTWWKRPVLEMLTLWQTWRGYKYQRQISELIKTYQINVIHTSTIVNPEGAIAARRNKLPHVWHVRELIGPNSYYSFPRFKSWIKYVENHAGFLIANSEATAKNLTLYFSQAIIKCIPNGINPQGYHRKVHGATSPLVVAMVGNVTSRLKNHAFFIKTAATFRHNQHVIFRIYGGLPAHDDLYFISLKKLIHEYGLNDTVSFMGHQESEKIMTDIDILFHPTGLESFGRIFIEAMAGGIPIIAVDDGGAVELVRNNINGFRLAENDSIQASAAIQHLLNSADLRNELGRNGREILENEYTLSLLQNRIRNLYDEMLKVNRQRNFIQ